VTLAPKKTRDIVLRFVAKHMSILNHLDVTHECNRQTDGRTDGWTDLLEANAELNYVARSKNHKAVLRFGEKPH